jgi:sugar fermentation stimulation protein A
MDFSPSLTRVRFLRRYKRFLADVALPDGDHLTVHCPNPGGMLGLCEEGAEAWISDSRNPRRKLRYTLELLRLRSGALVLVNTQRPNAIAEEAVRAGGVPELSGFAELRRERPYGAENSRIDLWLSGPSGEVFVEVKSVTLEHEGAGYFPDAVTTRGQRHLRELGHVVAAGHRGVLLFVVGRDDVDRVRPARAIDPRYAELLVEAESAGVELLAYRLELSPERLELGVALPVEARAGAMGPTR